MGALSTDQPRRILVLYTGGTLGMVPTDRGYAPRPGFLAECLAKMPSFHEAGSPLFTTPPSRVGVRAHYHIKEYAPLLDSANLGMADWVHLARDIEQHYDDYDAFVILHGTDTMAYTAAALSFMLVNNRKTVILTGSQIPLLHARNDAVDNLLGALTVAAHYEIPEVGLYFRGKLHRGNRCRKVDAEGLDAFQSPNMSPLAEIGTRIHVNWDLVRIPQDGALRVRPITTPHVAAIRWFPGLSAEILDRILQPPLRGVVLETYGAGNAPDNQPAIHEALRRGTDAGIVLVNITQCVTGRVTDDYAAGRALREAGVVGGVDMTPEAALTKLAYLLSQGLSVDEVRHLMAVDLRGELTPLPEQGRYSFRDRAFVQGVARVLQAEDEAGVGRALLPTLAVAAAFGGDLDTLLRLSRSGAALDGPDPDGRTPLRAAASAGHHEVVAWLLNAGVSPNTPDALGRTALFEALRHGHDRVAVLLRAHGAAEPDAKRLALRSAAEAGDLHALRELLDED